MTILSLSMIGLVSISIVIYLLIQFVLNEKQIYKIKYILFVGLIFLWSIIITPFFFIRPRNILNLRLLAIIVHPSFKLFGIKYRTENMEVLDKEGSCVIVANHQSSIDVISMNEIWAEHVRYCTILAKQELLWAFPLGLILWLVGIEFVDRKNRERSNETLRHIAEKIQNKSLRLWVFPEGTRSMNDTLLPFKYGAFRLAIQAQVPIVPIVFSSYKPFYNADKESNSYYWRRGCVIIKCLEPIDTKGMTIENDLHRLTEMTRQRMIDAYESIQTISDDKKEN